MHRSSILTRTELERESKGGSCVMRGLFMKEGVLVNKRTF